MPFDFLDRRKFERRDTNAPATIRFGREQLDCVVRNISVGGAMLELAKVRQVPDSFQLHESGKSPRPCRVRWRALKGIGVEFVNRL
jgi:hypothetical protein